MTETKICLPTERMWYRCPYCGKKLLIYDNAAKCSGIYIQCKKCKREVEVRIAEHL